MFQESLQTLKIAKSKFAGSKDALEQIGSDWQDKQILVPLTGSMYVPGIVKSVDKFIIDVGTGYYVEKVCNVEQFNRRIGETLTIILFYSHQFTGLGHLQRLFQTENRLCARANG